MESSGAINDRDKYSELFLRVTRLAGIAVPIAAILYGAAVWAGIIDASPLYSTTALVIVSIIFLLLAVVQYILKPNTPFSLGIFIALYHIFGAAYLIVGPGFVSPIVFCWLVLNMITGIFYGRLTGMLSMLPVLLTGVWLYVSEPVVSLELTTSYIAYGIVVAACSIFISMLRSVDFMQHKDLKRTQTQEQLERGQLLTLINSLNAAILSTSTAGTVRVYNAALLSLLDTNQSLSGKNIDDVLNLYNASGEPVSLVELTRTSKKIVDRDDLSHRFSDGESIRLNISCAPIRGNFSSKGGHREGFIFIMRDITQEKSLEEERDEFISVVSHELRTPITIAEGSLSNLQLLLKRGHDPGTLDSAIKDAHEQVIYLASMVNDLSTLSRAERGVADKPETVDVRALLEEIYHRYLPKAVEKKLKLDIDTSHKLGTVLVSRLYLEEILQNFVTNAIKYTLSGSITIAAHRSGHEIEFSVSDTGIGISKSEQKHIFEKFYRSEDYRTRETSGTGLGLYVVHKLADKMGIEVKFESRLNHGSRFSFVLTDVPKGAKQQNILDETVPADVHLT